MSDAPFVPFYTSDFLSGTGGMTAATKGVYITLLCLIYEAEGPIAQKWDNLARRCGCTLPAFKKAVRELEEDGKITVLDAGIWSEKCEKHLARRRERQRGAKAAAEKRWQKTQQKQRQADAPAMRKGCQPEPEPEVEKEETNVSSKKHRGTRLPDDWALPADWGQWALAEGWDEFTVRREAEKFRDYWTAKPGAQARKVNWKATWRNWMRNSKGGRPGGQRNSSYGSADPDHPQLRGIFDAAAAVAARGHRHG